MSFSSVGFRNGPGFSCTSWSAGPETQRVGSCNARNLRGLLVKGQFNGNWYVYVVICTCFLDVTYDSFYADTRSRDKSTRGDGQIDR